MAFILRLHNEPSPFRRGRSWWVSGICAEQQDVFFEAAFDCSTFYCKRGLRRALRRIFGKTARAYG